MPCAGEISCPTKPSATTDKKGEQKSGRRPWPPPGGYNKASKARMCLKKNKRAAGVTLSGAQLPGPPANRTPAPAGSRQATAKPTRSQEGAPDRRLFFSPGLAQRAGLFARRLQGPGVYFLSLLAKRPFLPSSSGLTPNRNGPRLHLWRVWSPLASLGIP